MTLALSELSIDAERLAYELLHGKPELGWRGDPRLDLRVGIITAASSGIDARSGRWHRRGDRLGLRYEVWRTNEDGTELRILARRVDQFYEIIPELITLDPRTPGFKPTMDRIEEHNTKVDKAKSTAVAEAHGEQAEHLWKLVADRQNGRTTHYQVGGSRDAGK